MQPMNAPMICNAPITVDPLDVPIGIEYAPEPAAPAHVTESCGESVHVALDRIDALRKAGKTAHLTHSIIEAERDKFGRITRALIDWQVITA